MSSALRLAARQHRRHYDRVNFRLQYSRFVSAETAVAAMITMGILGAFAGRTMAKFLSARRKRRLRVEADNNGDT